PAVRHHQGARPPAERPGHEEAPQHRRGAGTRPVLSPRRAVVTTKSLTRSGEALSFAIDASGKCRKVAGLRLTVSVERATIRWQTVQPGLSRLGSRPTRPSMHKGSSDGPRTSARASH